MLSSWDSDYHYEPMPVFEQTLCCLPFHRYKNPELKAGNKIIMPQSCLSLLLFTIPDKDPLILKIQSLINSDKTSHCGVLQFCDEEAFVYVPRWMMRNLNIQDGDFVVLRYAALSKGKYMKMRPHHAAFSEVPDPKTVLETALRVFPCLSRGDTITVRHNQRDFYLDVLEVNPGGEAVSLIDTTCELEFAPALGDQPKLDYDGDEPPLDDEIEEPPLDYEDDEIEEPPLDYEDDEIEEPPLDNDEREMDIDGDQQLMINQNGEVKERDKEFRPFTGAARRLDGMAVMVKREKDGGELDEKVVKKAGGREREEVRGFRPFTGAGRLLDGTVQGDGCSSSSCSSSVVGCPAAAEEEKKREKYSGKDEAKDKFKPFSGKSRILGGSFFD